MALSRLLNQWVAESGSWQSFIDFQLPEDVMADYSFLKSKDDFFISLMSNAFELFKLKDFENNSEILLSIAKGLEIYSLKDKKEKFKGVNFENNLLYASGLYYLANYAASAWILSKIATSNLYEQKIDQFISGFLRRNLNNNNFYINRLKSYLYAGEIGILNRLKTRIERKLKISILSIVDIETYCSSMLSIAILIKFSTDNIWYDLLKQNDNTDHWRDYVQQSLSKKVPIWSFFPSQRAALEQGVLSENTCSLQMPTSSGKSFLAELVIYNEFKMNPDCRILYLAPFRAMASELKHTLATSLANLGISSKTIYGGNLPTIEERPSVNEVNLLVATPEKFLAFEDVFPDISADFTTIICDEGHLLDDQTRGLSYELLLSRLKAEKNVKRRFIFISAIIPNIDVINSWLGGTDQTLLKSNYRPTQLEFAFLKKMDSRSRGYYLDINPTKSRPENYQLYKYLFDEDLKICNIETGRTKNITSKIGISSAVVLKAVRTGTVALFTTEKRGNRGVEKLVSEIVNQIENKDEKYLLEYSPENFLTDLEQYFSIVFGADYLLTKSAVIGVLYHHGDIPQGVREIIEDAVRRNFIRLVVCTNTLAEGVNLPIKTIVIHSTIRYNPKVGYNESINKRDLKNIVGRAGRAGKETKGFIIVPHEEDFEIITKVIQEKEIEPVNGELYNIIQLINNYLQNSGLQLSAKILDSQGEEFQQLLDSIDLSLIDLLAEDVEIDSLKEFVDNLLSQTLSFYQSSDDEKETSKKLFELRADKLIPIIEENNYKNLKYSGTSLRKFTEFTKSIDFDNDVWEKEFGSLDEDWIEFIFDSALFNLDSFLFELQNFNAINRCELLNRDVKEIALLWMHGKWFSEISNKADLEMHQLLRLINNLIGYNIQSTISTIIRLRELLKPDKVLSPIITNWPSLLQHGINSQLQLNIIEMGLIDRVAVYGVSDYLESTGYKYSDYKELRSFLIESQEEIKLELYSIVPNISFNKIDSFLKKLDKWNMF